MGRPIVHFEIIGNDPGQLRSFYGDLFGWEYASNRSRPDEVAELVGDYGLVEPSMSSAGVGIPAGIGGGPGFDRRASVYVGVPDVEAALRSVEALGGARLSGPHRNETGDMIVALFADPEGNVVGLVNVT